MYKNDLYKGKIIDKEFWDENLLEAYKCFFNKVNELDFSSIVSYKKYLDFAKENLYARYELIRFFNQVFPMPEIFKDSHFIHNHITELLKSENVLYGFDEYLINQGIYNFLDFKNELKGLEETISKKGITIQSIKSDKEKRYQSNPIKVEGNNIFFHATSKETFEKIKSDGFLIYQKCEPNSEFQFLSQISEYDKNRLYLTNNFDEEIYYALRKSLDGYVIGVNLDGYTLYNSDVSMHHFWTTEKISKDRFVKIYHIVNENNNVIIEEDAEIL